MKNSRCFESRRVGVSARPRRLTAAQAQAPATAQARALAKTTALVVALAALLFASCTGRNERRTEITLIHGWGSTESDHVAMRKIYSDFQAANPDISIRQLAMPHADDVVQKVGDMLMVGEVPDLVFFGGAGNDSEYVYKFMVQNDLAVDIMPFIKADDEFRTHVAKSNVDYWIESDGSLYTLSDVLLASGGYWYNKEIFRAAGVAELPSTWDDFFEMCRLVEKWSAEQENNVVAMAFTSESALYLLGHMINMAQKMELADALEEIKKIYSSDISKSNSVFFGEYTYRDETTLFNDGALAVYINGVWAASMIKDGANVGYALLPSGRGSTLSCESSSLGFVVGNSGNSERINAAMRFLAYIMSDAVQERILVESGQVPASPVVDTSSIADTKPLFYDALQLVRNAENKIEVPNNLWTPHEKNVLQTYMRDFIVGDISLEDFLSIM